MSEFNPRRNIRLVFLFSFTWMFLPVIPVILPYAESLGFSMTEFLQLQAIFGLAVAIMEVPSGYFADLFGRKRALFWASLISSLGFTYLYFARSFTDFAIYQVLVAVGFSLASGADFSLLYDSKTALELKEGGKHVKVSGSHLISRFHFFRLLAEAISAVCGGILASIGYGVLLIFTAITAWLSMFVVYFLQEPPIDRTPTGGHRENFKKVLSVVFKESALLRLIYFNFVLWSLGTFCAVWLIQKYWADSGLDLIWFGVLWAGFQMVAGFSGIWAVRLERTVSLSNLLILSCVFTLLGYLLLGTLPVGLGIFVGVLFYLSRGFNQVLYGEALNRRISGEFRATINSLYAMGMRVCFMFLGPLIGLVIDRWGLEIALLSLAGFYLITGLLLLRPLILSIRSEALHQAL